MTFYNFGGPGAHFGGPGTHFEDFWDCCDLGNFLATKGEGKIAPITHFLQCCFFYVFLMLVFSFVMFLGALRLNLWSHVDVILGTLGL